MADDIPTRVAGEGKRVLSLIAGAFIFYFSIAIVTFLMDHGGLSPGSSSYIGAWFLGAGLSSSFGVEVAGRVAPNCNCIGLIVLMVAPIALLAVGIFLTANFSSQAMLTA